MTKSKDTEYSTFARNLYLEANAYVRGVAERLKEERLASGFDRNKDPIYRSVGRTCRVFAGRFSSLTVDGVSISPNVRITHPFKHG